MIAFITAHLRSLSPSYRAAALAARIERARRIGYARHAARKAMLRAAAVEHGEWHVSIWPSGHEYATRGPGYLPRACWLALRSW